MSSQVNILSGNYLASGGYFEVLQTGIIPNLISTRGIVIPSSTSFHGDGTTGLAFNLSFPNQDDLRNHYNNQYWTFFTGTNSFGPFREFSQPHRHQYKSTGIIISSGTFLPGRIPGTNFFARALIRPLTITDRIELLENSGNFALRPNQRVSVGIPSSQASEKVHIAGGNVRIDGNVRITGSILNDLNVLGNIKAGVISGTSLLINGQTPNFGGGGGGDNAARGACGGSLVSIETSGIGNIIATGIQDHGNYWNEGPYTADFRGTTIVGGAYNLISGVSCMRLNTIHGSLFSIIVNNQDQYNYEPTVADRNVILGSEKTIISRGSSNVVIGGRDNLITALSSGNFHHGSHSLIGFPSVYAGEPGEVGGWDYFSSSQGACNNVSFGDELNIRTNNNLVLSDGRFPLNIQTGSHAAYVNYLNGIKFASVGINLDDISYNSLSEVWLKDIRHTSPRGIGAPLPAGWNPRNGSTINLYGPTAKAKDGIQQFLWWQFKGPNAEKRHYINDPAGLENVPDLNFAAATPEQPLNRLLRDAYGNNVTGLLLSGPSSAFPINIGGGNRYYPAVITAAYKDNIIDIYGENPPLPGVGVYTPNPNIIVGHGNNAALYDIIIGTANNHEYQQEDNRNQREKLLTYTSHTPTSLTAYSLLLGHNNSITGSMNVVAGVSNFLKHSKGDANIIGNSNTVIPKGYYEPVTAASILPDGSVMTVISGWQTNSSFSAPAKKAYSNVIGYANRLELDPAGFVHVIGAFNRGDNIANSQILGSSNYTTGFGINILGQTNTIASSATLALGDNNWAQWGSHHVFVGSNNFIRNTQFTTGLWPMNHLIVGYFNTINQTSYENVFGTNNFLNHWTGSHNTILGHANNSFGLARDVAVLGNANIISAEKSYVVGHGNKIDPGFLALTAGGLAKLNNNQTIEENIALGFRNSFGASKAASLGGDNYLDQDNSIALGQNAYTYNYGQISYSSTNLVDAASANVANAAVGGASQKTTLIWKGISTGNAAQEIYLDNTAYNPSHNLATESTFGPRGRAYIPSGRMWNGTINITIAETGLRNIRTISQAFTMANTGNKNLPMNMLTRNTIADISLGSSLSSAGVLFSGDNKNEKLAIWVTGLSNRLVHWNISADFLDTWVPGANNQFMHMYNQDGESINILR